MTKDNQKRISLYFNLEVEDEAKMWEYLSKKKKSNFIKNLIQNEIKNDSVHVAAQRREVVDDGLKDIDIDNDAIDFN